MRDLRLTEVTKHFVFRDDFHPSKEVPSHDTETINSLRHIQSNLW